MERKQETDIARERKRGERREQGRIEAVRDQVRVRRRVASKEEGRHSDSDISSVGGATVTETARDQVRGRGGKEGRRREERKGGTEVAKDQMRDRGRKKARRRGERQGGTEMAKEQVRGRRCKEAKRQRRDQGS